MGQLTIEFTTNLTNRMVTAENSINANFTELYTDVAGRVPSTREITVNGVTQDLSQNRTFTITDANLSTSDVTTNNASTTKHGFLKKLSNVSTEYMDGTGNWSTPPGGVSDVAYDSSWVGVTTVAPSKNAVYDKINSMTQFGYTLMVQADNSSPLDAQTLYFGHLPTGLNTTANINNVYIRKAGTLNIAEIYTNSATAGSNENWSLYIRVNNTTDYLIATLGVATNERIFSNTALGISLSAGDYFQIKMVCPTWATNPATVRCAGYVYIE